MKIIIKESDRLKSGLHKEKVVSEYLIYLMSDDNTPLSCDITYGVSEKNKVVNGLLLEHFTPSDWNRDKESLLNNLNNIIEEVSYDTFLTQ